MHMLQHMDSYKLLKQRSKKVKIFKLKYMHCMIMETVQHYIMDCSHYNGTRSTLYYKCMKILVCHQENFT